MLPSHLSARVLQSRLPEPYFVQARSRAWVEISQRAIGPDVNVIRPRDDG